MEKQLVLSDKLGKDIESLRAAVVKRTRTSNSYNIFLMLTRLFCFLVITLPIALLMGIITLILLGALRSAKAKSASLADNIIRVLVFEYNIRDLLVMQEYIESVLLASRMIALTKNDSQFANLCLDATKTRLIEKENV